MRGPSGGIMRSVRSLLRMAFGIVLCSSVCSASVVISPSSARINPNAQLQFSATGSSVNVVLWSLSGSGCVGTSCGIITSDGLYTAPSTAPNPATVNVIATSLSDLAQSATAVVTIGSQQVVGVTLSPLKATIGQLGQQQFSASVTGASNVGLTWSVSGTGCSGAACGTISSTGLYTAPATVPSGSITVTARSVADSTKSVSAVVTIVPATAISVSVAPSGVQIDVKGMQQFSATVSGSTNTSVHWTVTGPGCIGSACGSISATGLYTAPPVIPTSAKVIVTATAIAAPSRSASATATIVSSASQLLVSPASVQLKPGAQVQFTASGPGSGVVVWSLSGNGCSGNSCGQITSTGLYTAPATAPNPPNVTVSAIALSNPSLVGSALVSISSTQVWITVSPDSIQLNVGAQQQFKAAVTGTTNTAVSWSVSGYSCAGAACGTITAGGLYTAPAVLPNPSIIFITATSQADSSKSSTVTVTLAMAIAVTLSPTTAQVPVNGNQQFTAKVTGTTVTGVTWTVAGTGCSGGACGMISSNGLYTAPASAPSPATVIVTATSIADSQKSASASVTIVVPITVTISPTIATVSVGQQLQFNSSVTGSANTAVAWSVSGSGCSGSACGTISTKGLYTAPPSVASQTTAVVKATSQAASSKSASAVITILPSNNAKLSGLYAFLFTGFDKNGVYQEAGSIRADGNGKIISGFEDVNDTINPSKDISISGTYQIDSDNRGVLVIRSPLGVQTLRVALNLSATKGRLISFDQSGIRGSGEIDLQTSTDFDPAVFTGGYVFGLTGMNFDGNRIGALGLIFPDGNGFIAGSSLDVNEAGVVSPTFATFSGTYSVSSTGRGIMSLNIPGFDGGSFTFAFYVVSADRILLISIDPFSADNPMLGGHGERQSGTPFTTSSFQGGSVFGLSGTNGISSDDTVGRVQFNTGGTIQVNFDQNNGGALTVGGVMTGAYDVELNGRGTLNLDNPSDNSVQIWYIYAVAPNKAFVMDASTSRVAVGEMSPQTTPVPFSNSDLLGTYNFGSDEAIVFGTPLYSGVATFDGGSSLAGSGATTLSEDLSTAVALSPNLQLTGTYSVSTVSNNGRATILLGGSAGQRIAVWIASPTECVGLGIDASTSQPTILHFEQ